MACIESLRSVSQFLPHASEEISEGSSQGWNADSAIQAEGFLGTKYEFL